jgi:hypothetical protein
MEFSTAVILGLRSVGISDQDIQSTSGVSAAVFKAIVRGDRKFTNRQLLALEGLVDLTAGQLAARALEPDGGPLTELFKSWTPFHQLTRRSAGKKKSRAVGATAK